MLAALLWGAALGVVLLGGALESRGGCARHLQWVPQPHSETFAQAQHQPYLTLCGGRVCSTYRTTYRVASRRVERRVLRPGLICQQAPTLESLSAHLKVLQERMEALEQALGGPLQYLDRVETLGEQLMDLEERLGACDCGGGKNAFGYKTRR
ncbi:epidermal growth factor-like protein 8 [Aquila chrysaetos chrysaetos]|uniref:epidermal growth factor-like protein 8 n=1 Tax=Aquila chrysaetos chrysaetos TaxID=223781 RepID=UPI001176F1AB|nr:epidermal growth factor-like protein 8 [Aquila chrysaetos chrysaetos]